MAICNLGLENWPDRWLPSEPMLIRHDLVSVFQVGWTVLHEDVCMFAADQLIGVLATLQCIDSDIQHGIETLARR